jgi:hypothetical protein
LASTGSAERLIGTRFAIMADEVRAVITEVLQGKEGGASLPGLVREGRARGVPENATRVEAQRMIERGELRLDRQMRVKLATVVAPAE